MIKRSVELIAAAAIDGCKMQGDLLIAFTCIGRPQLVEAFEVVLKEDVSSEANSAL